ncbi:hypothetical protein OG196_01895 [Kitasatospora purpeofusca]|uniref:hypothetical protein n=1 Tax=Kitasatospora purpeofusca TaxID=67352 RepID=UPI002E0F33BE|nr:hypothetical protein OG715_01340 [Kitasatospora purpeofusca]WSR37934.1 hypothetical protein OG196_01895 [Kitasatospora purpeofusca]
MPEPGTASAANTSSLSNTDRQPTRSSNRAAWLSAWATVASALVAAAAMLLATGNGDSKNSAPTGTGAAALPGGAEPVRPTPSPTCGQPPVTVAPQLVNKENVSLSQSGQGEYEVTVRSYADAGLHIALPDTLCTYTVDLDARISSIASSAPRYGYQVGTCDTWQAGQGRGFTVGYARDGATDMSNWAVMPSGSLQWLSLAPDSGTHHWHLDVSNSRVTVNFDHQRLGTFPLTNKSVIPSDPQEVASLLPADCGDSGIFLRVSNATVRFFDIRVQSLKG